MALAPQDIPGLGSTAALDARQAAARDFALDYLAALAEVGDEAVSLGEAALALALIDRPEIDLTPYRAFLDGLADTVATEAASSSPGDPVAALAGAIADHAGITGDAESYDDLANADLTRVIDRRRGLPVAVGILYLDCARRQGWSAHGLNFPGHFLIGVEGLGGRAILDPFHGGRALGPDQLTQLLSMSVGQNASLDPEYLEAVPHLTVLLRLRNNLKLRHLKAARYEDAARIIASMILLAPEDAGLWRDCGIVQGRIGNLAHATAAFERVTAMTKGRAKEEALGLLASVRARLN